MKKNCLAKTFGILHGLLVPIVLLALWQWLSSQAIVNPMILPAPTRVLAKWWEYLMPAQAYDPATSGYLAWMFSGEMIHDAYASMYRVTVGFVVGAILALPLGLIMGANDRVYKLFNPLIQILRPIPPIAFIPLSILWFGLGNPPAIFLIVIGAFFPILMNTIAGVRNVDGIYIRAARSLGASQTTMFLRVILPAATPYILTGMRIGVGTAFIVVIVAEMIAVNNGLGYRILEAREFFWSDKIIAGMFTIGLLGLAIDTGMNRLNNHLLKWHRGIENK
ncbi:MAG: Sulfonate/nitrate/taurine transport system permease protein [Candidatus Gallionella acididurans]|uniref:Sulfonate/nitrate/taurine transport system permease protein n=1 Tax=Candidatus Gallionella acididurans TaxID=1796491 RepID=A0A139BW20_9PROT|nr:MAG: Sulfonate/nitrate/taurine transport system permease protein [Candidatus Gallionella acididurans]